MKSNVLEKFPSSPIYNKALEIFTLSRNIATYLIDDITVKNPHDFEDPSLYVTGDILQQSVSLAPEILKAEQQTFQEEKYKYIQSVDRLAIRLSINCERLEKANSNGKDFLPILKKELKKFKKLQRTWMLTL